MSERARPLDCNLEQQRLLTWISNEELRKLLKSITKVAMKGFVIGSSLHAGMGLVAGVTGRKLFQSPSQYLINLLSKDMARFGIFIAVSSSSYKAITKLLERWLLHNAKDHHLWWVPIVGGFSVGLASFIDESNRRRNITLFILARALGALIQIFNHHGTLPAVPCFVPTVFALCSGIIVMCVARYPNLLPPSYYRAILRWSLYYTDKILQVYFRDSSDHFITCQSYLHTGTCNQAAAKDFINGLQMYTKLYIVLYSIPLILFRTNSLLSSPYQSLKHLITNTAISALFFAIDATIAKYVICLLRNWFGGPSPASRSVSFIGGFMGALGFLIERPSRQIELVYYVLPQVFYTIWRLLCIKKPLKLHKMPAGSVWLFCLSMMAIMYAYQNDRKTLAPLINRAFDFLLND